MRLCILISEPDEAFRNEVSRLLSRHEVVAVADAGMAREALHGRGFDLVITSLTPGDPCGPALLEEARSLDPKPLLLVTVSQADEASAVRAIRSGAYDCLLKRCDGALLSAALGRATGYLKSLAETRELVKSLKRNVEALGLQSRRLERMAIHDEMTGLHNYRYLREAFDRELARCRRYDRPLSLLFADIDSFKNYNDTQGHLAGDTLLATLAQLIVQGSRESTVVARYGGEEFALLVPEAAHDGALIYAEKLRALVARHPFHGGETQPGGRLTISVGVATYPEHGADANALLRQADEALYRAKRSGRNSVCGFPSLLAHDRR